VKRNEDNTVSLDVNLDAVTINSTIGSTSAPIKNIKTSNINTSYDSPTKTLNIDPLKAVVSSIDRPVGRLKEGEGTEFNYDTSTGDLTIKSTATGSDGITVGGLDVEGTTRKDYEGVKNVQLDSTFKVFPNSSDPSQLLVGIRHEGAFLGIFDNFEALALAAREHRGSFNKGKIVGWVRDMTPASTGVSSKLKKFIVFSWAADIDNPSDEQVKQKQNWDSKQSIAAPDFPFMQVGKGTDYPNFNPLASAPNYGGLTPSTHKGQMVFTVDSTAGSAKPVTWWYCDGIGWESAVLDGKSQIAVSVEGQAPIDKALGVKFKATGGATFSMEQEGSAGAAIAKLTLKASAPISATASDVKVDEIKEIIVHDGSSSKSQILNGVLNVCIPAQGGGAGGPSTVTVSGKSSSGSSVSQDSSLLSFGDEFVLTKDSATKKMSMALKDGVKGTQFGGVQYNTGGGTSSVIASHYPVVSFDSTLGVKATGSGNNKLLTVSSRGSTVKGKNKTGAGITLSDNRNITFGSVLVVMTSTPKSLLLILTINKSLSFLRIL